MLNKKDLLQFLLKARTKTYAGDGGKVQPVFNNSTQLEYREGDWFYRDIYYMRKGIFMGLEVVHYQNKPVWAASYYGTCKGAAEEEIYNFLKEALLANWKTARIWKKVESGKGDYKYICEPDFEGSIDELSGVEKISKQGKEVYRFFYAGGLIG